MIKKATAVLLFLVYSAFSFGVTYEIHPSSNSITVLGGISHKVGQTFTIGTTGPNVPFWLTSINTGFSKNGSLTTVTVQVFATSGGLPVGPALSTGTIPSGSYTSTAQMSGVYLQPNTQYVFIISSSFGDGNFSNVHPVFGGGGGVYSGGNCIYYDGSSWTQYTTWDITFSIYGTSILSGGSISGTQSKCYGGDPSTIANSVAANGGSGDQTYTWQYSTTSNTPGFGVWYNIAESNTVSYNPPVSYQTRYYARSVWDGYYTAYSNVVTITIGPLISSGIIAATQELCYNSDAPILSSTQNATGGTGSLTYQWEKHIGTDPGIVWSAISGATANTYNPGNLIATTDYRRTVTDAAGCSMTSNTVTYTVNPAVFGGIIGSGYEVPVGSTASLLSLAVASGGMNAFSYQWKSSLNSTNPLSGTWTDVSGATNEFLITGNLTDTTSFVRLATDVQCGSAYSNVVTVNTTAETVSGPLAYWRFENNGNDDAGNHDLSILNSAGYSTGGYKLEGSYAANCDIASGNRFYTTTEIDFGANGQTISYAFKNDNATAGYPDIFSTVEYNGIYLKGFIDRSLRAVYLKAGDGSTTAQVGSANGAWGAAGDWVYVTHRISPNGAYCRTWVNGVLSGTDTTFNVAGFNWDRTSNFYIGGNGVPTSSFYGYIDNFSIHDCYLAASKIVDYYNNRTANYTTTCGGGSEPPVVHKRRRSRSGDVVFLNQTFPEILVEEEAPPPETDWTTLFAQDFTSSFNNVNTGRYTFDRIDNDFPLSYSGWDTDLHIVDSLDCKGNISRMVRVDYPQGTIAMDHGTEFTSWIQPEGPDYDGTDIVVSCNFKLKSGYHFVKGMKFLGLDMHSSVDYDPGGIPPAGSQGSHGHYVFQGQGMGRFYDYIHVSQPAPYYGSGIFIYYRVQSGVWYNMKQRFVRNTIGQSNGFHEVFINNRLIARYSGLKWSERDTVGFNELRFSFFMGGGDDSFAPIRDEYLLIDDVKVLTDPALGEAFWDPDVLMVGPDKEVTSFTEYVTQTYTASSGNVRNTSYPNNYAGDTYEVRKIHAPAGHTITITPTFVKLGSSDYVAVIDGDSPLDMFESGTLRTYGDWAVTTQTTNGAPFTSTGNDVTIVIAADNNNNSGPTGLSFSFAYVIN
jgi:hypothetical protein